MNEATLEARVNSEIKALFPTLDRLRITHQKTYKLKLGRREVIIDSSEYAYGKSDILVELDGKPLLVLELKQPGETITDDDRDQCVSYARLSDPMAPLSVVSNGSETTIYKTIDKTPWVAKTVDEQAVEDIMKHALFCAETEIDDAVRKLLGQRPEIWVDIIRKYTEKELNKRAGDVNEFTLPLIDRFSIRRFAVDELYGLLSSRERLIALVGPPLSGKTNVIAQLCDPVEYPNIIPLYVDTNCTSYGVFNYLSDMFNRELFKAASPDDTKIWLIQGLRRSVEGRLVILIDGWNVLTKVRLQEDLDELIQLNDDGYYSILLGMDENSYEDVITIPGRPTKTELGKTVKTVYLRTLNDMEFEDAENAFFNSCGTLFHKGAQYNLEFRRPRLLRLIAAKVNEVECEDTPSNGKVNITAHFIPSVTNLYILEEAWKRYADDPVLKSDMNYFAKAYIEDERSRKEDPELALMAYGTGCLTQETAEGVIGNDRLKRLRDQGHMRYVQGPNNKILVSPRVPEFLSISGAYIIANKVTAYMRQDSVEDGYNYLISKSVYFPYCDLVGAKAIYEVSQKGVNIIEIINRLLEDKPHETTVSNKSDLITYIPEIGIFELPSSEVGDGIVTANQYPWLLLSHLASMKIANEPGTWELRLQIIATVGAYPNILIRVDNVPLRDKKGYHVHDIPGQGQVICGKVGIIEPITYAMQMCFYEIPNEIVEVCEYAKEISSYSLASRLKMAANSVKTCTNEEVAKASKRASEILKSVLSLSSIRKAKSVGKVGRNDPCPCGSGKKYKKCCGRS